MSCCLLFLLVGCSHARPPVTMGDIVTRSQTPSTVTGTATPTAGSGSGAGKASGATNRPKVLVGVKKGKGVRDSGSLVVLDPTTGSVMRTLDPALVVGDAVQLSPDRTSVYYEKAIGCRDQIWTVSLAGGTPKKLVEGSLPALSPDGTKLAYSTRILGDSCIKDSGTYTASFGLAVRSLVSGNTRSLPLHPEQKVVPPPIGHLSWSPDGAKLAVSVSSSQDNEGWSLQVVDPETDTYYMGETDAGSSVPATGPGNTATPAVRLFFRQGVFLPNGHLFVVHRCCSGWDPKTTSELLQEVDPVTGAVERQIAVGLLTADHTSLDSDVSGRWLLYLSGDRVMVAESGAEPATLVTGYQAVDW